VLYNCLSWYKFAYTHLYHSRQLLGPFYGAIAVPSVTRFKCFLYNIALLTAWYAAVNVRFTAVQNKRQSAEQYD